MAATSMMKEYVKRQLKYWLDNFKDDQLPRDFNSKSFARSHITLHKITFKPDKIASLLHIPSPLIVVRATCSELTIKVPSWQLAEKFVQEPLRLQLGDLFVDVKHMDECDEHVRTDATARARAASLEPDPLGSIASMYQFATVILERLELQVENIYLKLYERHALRVQVELAHFHARTTNALWQDMRDLTDCVDRSPDGLLKTRFKFVSAQCSVFLHDTPETPPLRLLRDHAIAMRMTLFGHRPPKQSAWDVLSRVIDLNLETLPIEMTSAHVQQVYAMAKTLVRWMHEAAAAKNKGELLPHQMERAAPLTPTRTANKEPEKGGGGSSVHTFALQITVRFTAHILLRMHSAKRGDVLLAVIAQHAALHYIQHDARDAATELQLALHDLSVRHKDKVLFYAKPARDMLQLERTPTSVFVKWHLQKVACHLESDMAVLANELFHSLKEIEQAATITCGTCHHKIRLDAIATHVCASTATPLVSADSSRHSSNGVHHATLLDSTQIPKLRLVLALDELEVVTDSGLFRSVHELMHDATDSKPLRRFVLTVKDWSVSTEAQEFVGDAIFVPVLPLAFQMLECTLRGCGCVQQQENEQATELFVNHDARPQWPDRVFAELGHFALRATDHATQCETFLTADSASLRLSFSDGTRVCPHSAPQMSCLVHVERIRCQVDDTVYNRVRKMLEQLQNPLAGAHVTALVLFFAVLEIRNVEFTLLKEMATKLKAQFRHVASVADNHQGFLSLQTNVDFRAVLQSDAITFAFEKEAVANVNDSISVPYVPKRERRRLRLGALERASAERIQRVFRVFVAARRQQLDRELRRLTHEDDDREDRVTVAMEVPVPVIKVPTPPPKQTEPVAPLPQRRPSSTSAKPSLSDDLAAINPMKMVAAAGVGVLGFVKAKQQRLETEMTELAMQSKDTASRLLPKYSAMKNLLSPKSASPLSSSSSLTPPVEMKTTEVRTAEAEDSSRAQEMEGLPLEEKSGSREPSVPSEGQDEEEEEQEGEEEEEEQGEKEEEEEEEEQTEEPLQTKDNEEQLLDETQDDPQGSTPPPSSAADILLALLPPIVQLTIQVEEHRLCVPIDPRVTVAVLGHEIVRRFNEMCGQHGVIARVTLQSRSGGVVADSDIVGLVCDPSHVWFAYAHDSDDITGIKSVIHMDPTTLSSGSVPAKGRAFAHCSKLPLPLVVALLANETERDLVRLAHDLDRAGDWPELALNAAFLAPARDMLHVDVQWPSASRRSVEVVNRDAFLLCLQQLGLCTSRENAKHVGKILRDRLKMDVRNPLIAAACRASREFLTDEDVAYASLQAIVQEDYGVYTRVKD